MTESRTSHGEPANAQARWRTNPLHGVPVIETGDTSAPQRPLPCRADRQKIVEQASLVLSEARAIAEQVDQHLVLHLAERAADCPNAAASPFVVA